MKTSISAILILMASMHLQAVDWRYTLFSNVRYSDNLNQTTNNIEGYAVNAGFTFNLNNEPDAELYYITSGLFGWTTFSQDNIDNEYVRGFNGNLVYQPKNTNFKLLAVENLSQVPQNRFVTQEINNLRDVEVSAVKPTYFFNLSGSDKLNIDYSHIVVDAANVNANINLQNGSRTINEGSMGYDRNINATNVVSIIARASATNYDDPLNITNQTGVDYNQKDIFARWTLTGISNLLRIDYGKSRVKTELDKTIDVDLLQFLFRRQLNRTHSVSLTYREGFDSIFNFELGTNTINVNNRSGDFGNTLKIKERRLSYDIAEDFFTSRISYFNEDLDSTLTSNTEKRIGLELSLVYRLSRLLDSPYDTNLAFTYFNSKNHFDSTLTQVTEDKVERFNLSFNYFISKSTFVFLQLQKRHSDSFIMTITNANIDSNTIFLGVSYAPNGRIGN